jgi:hypothetical protein
MPTGAHDVVIRDSDGCGECYYRRTHGCELTVLTDHYCGLRACPQGFLHASSQYVLTTLRRYL